MSNQRTIKVRTKARAQMIDITAELTSLLPTGFNGICLVFSLHTTAGMTINENADPDVTHDILEQLNRVAPWSGSHYKHGEGNSAAHVKASLVGSSVTVPVIDGRLSLGTWQGVYFCEFDGPRERRVLVQLLPAGGN